MESALKEFDRAINKLNEHRSSSKKPEKTLKESEKIVLKYCNSVNRSIIELAKMKDPDPAVQELKGRVGEQFKSLSSCIDAQRLEMDRNLKKFE